MVQWDKVLAAKPDDHAWDPHSGKRDLTSHKLSSDLCVGGQPLPTYTQNKQMQHNTIKQNN